MDMEDMDEVVSRYFERNMYGTGPRVRENSDTVRWHNSIAYYELITYISRTSYAIQGVRQDYFHLFTVSKTIQNLCGLIDKLALFIPTSISPRQSYNNWSRQMLRTIYLMLEKALPGNKCEHVPELGQYLAGSFGNHLRNCYGTGHELSFIFFMCGLFRAEILEPEDEPAAALLLFQHYLKCVRLLQRKFSLNSAGNQGAYSLDDYQFVAFLWGAAQLCYNPPFKPKELLDPSVYVLWRNKYLIAGCVAYVAKSKEGTFGMHSSQLWSVTALPNWTDIYDGLLNMYRKEVICQFNMLRNLCFGELMPFEPVPHNLELLRVQLGQPSEEMQQLLLLSREPEDEVSFKRSNASIRYHQEQPKQKKLRIQPLQQAIRQANEPQQNQDRSHPKHTKSSPINSTITIKELILGVSMTSLSSRKTIRSDRKDKHHRHKGQQQ